MPSPLSAPFLAGLVTAVLYARGRRRQLRITSPAHRRFERGRALAFWLGLATVVLALDSGIDDQADRLFWVHMSQHVLLMMVAAPLLVLAAPWTPIWKGIPLRARRRIGAAWFRSRVWRGPRAAGRWIAAPVQIWVVFNVDLCLWHVPALYGATLRHQAIHDLEHVSFLLFAVLFWAQVIDSPPLRSRLDEPRRVTYLVLGATVSWLLAVVLAFAPSPLYSAYASLHSRPGALSALADQQIAAGIMWGPGSIPYAVFVFLNLYRWLGPTRPIMGAAAWEPAAALRRAPRPAPSGADPGPRAQRS